MSLCVSRRPDVPCFVLLQQLETFSPSLLSALGPYLLYMSHRPPADASDALMTELATIPNTLGFVVFDLAGKKVARLCHASAPFACNALRSLLALASLKVQIL